MTLASGTRLGPYEIVAPLGAGGMGEVYRARDTRLNREVAIKILPELFATDDERLARFEREAQLLASLNHPHIAHVYGVEEIARGRALVMEFVDGEDLAQRLARGALPIDEAVRVARQIADALESAHERGIIHRDLKPANIKVAADGTVKVLDFGLAKALDAATGSHPSPLMNSPTLTSPATVAGVVLGTAAYMSPEQAKGKAADKRADIWAFGVVLYEMLTGARLFEGDSIVETMGLVATRDVDLSRLPPATPSRIRELVRRCLERDPKQRLRDIGEARIAIDTSMAEPPDAAPTPAAQRKPSAARRLALLAGVLLLVAAASAATWWWTTSRQRELPHRRFVLAAPGVGGTNSREFAISPDGRRIVFAANRRLQVWELDRLRPRELKGAGEIGVGDAAPAPFWSPDSESIGYAASGRLWRISAKDGDPTAICNAPGVIGGGAWQEDGTIAFFTTRGAMYQVASAGGDPKVLIALPEDGSVIDFHQPAVLPDGRGIVYSVHGRTGTDTIEVFSAGTRKVVLRAEQRARVYVQVFNQPAYSPTGHLLYRLDEGNVGVWAVPFDLDRLATTGEPFLVASGARNPSVAADGTLVYAPTVDAAPGQLVWLRPDGTVDEKVGDVKIGLDSPAVAPDGRIAFGAVENNNTDVWVFSPTQGTTRITATPANETRPQWMPDGRTLAFSCTVEGSVGGAVCTKAADGSGDTQVLIKNGVDVRVAPDGRHLIYQTAGTAERGLKIFDLTTRTSRPYLLAPFELLPMTFSPDGRYFAYQSYRSGQPRIYLRPFPGGDGEWEIPELRSERISWPRGGRELFAIVGSGREIPVAAVTVDTTGTPIFGKPRILFTATEDTMPLFRGFVAFPDGKRILSVQRQRSDSDVAGIVVVQNWIAEFGGKDRR